MKQRIKILYILTIAAIVAFGWLEGKWLRVKYDESLISTQVEMFDQVKEIFHNDSKQREGMLDEHWQAFFSLKNTYTGDSVVYDGTVVVAEKGMYTEEDYVRIFNQTKEKHLPGIIDYRECNAKGSNKLSQNRVTKAMKELVTEKAFPLQTDCIKCMIDSAFSGSSTVKIKTVDSLVWEPRLFLSKTMLNPKLEVAYPLNPFGYQVAVVTVPVSVSNTLKEMAMTLFLSFIVAVLLVFCLVYQMATIRRQQRVAELQKGFTLTMLHELKRPLGALKLFISFMRNKHLNISDKEVALANASREIDNLSSYFNKLRAITYNEASEVTLSLSYFNLKEAVEESVAKIYGAYVSLQGDDDTMIVAERQSIINVICNLIENAIKYSEPSKASEIKVYWNISNGGVEISVADRGRGIADADKQRVFDQFYRTAEDTEIPGMGLGLAYVRQVIDAHRGSISVNDRDGGGTIFTINLPQ